MTTYTEADRIADERSEINRVSLLALKMQCRELTALVEDSRIPNRKGAAMPLIDMEFVIAEMFESYSALKNK